MRKTLWITKRPRAKPAPAPPGMRGPLFKWNKKLEPTKEEREAFAGLMD